MQALFNEEGEKTSTKSYLNSDLNDFKSKSRIRIDIRRFRGISAYQSKSEKITLNKNWLNLDFNLSIWLAKESTKITYHPHPKLKTYLEIKVYLQSTDHDSPNLAL